MTDALRSALAAIAAALGGLDEEDCEELHALLSETASLYQRGVESETIDGIVNYLAVGPAAATVVQGACRYGGQCEPNLANNGTCYKCGKPLAVAAPRADQAGEEAR